ncbi:hypothetical protein HDU76_006281, partial [Blyttiomyces sp. JEL0837]
GYVSRMYSRSFVEILSPSIRPTSSSERYVKYAFTCTAIGAWFGGFVIPLDWNRPWQAWPVCVTYGGIVGYCVGVVLAALVTFVAPLLGSSTRQKGD